MGKPKKVEPTLLDTSYDWGAFGTADKDSFYFNDQTESNLGTARGGISQYVSEMLNPSYTNQSFANRQAQQLANNQAYAEELGRQAIQRGYRGNATQNILNSLNANQYMNDQKALINENTRINNILSALSGIESNYWNQGNAMGNNILQRYTTNVARQNAANEQNVSNYNAWRNNLWQGTGGAIGAAIGAYFGGGAGAAAGMQAGTSAGGMLEGMAS